MGVVPTKAHHTLGEPHIDAFAVEIEAMVLFQEMDDEPNEVGLAFNFWGIADDAEMSQAKSSQWTPGHSSFLLCWYRLSVYMQECELFTKIRRLCTHTQAL